MNPVERLFAALFQLVGALMRGILEALLPWLVERGPHIRSADASEVVPLRHAVLRPGQPVEAARWSGDDDPTTRHYVAEDPELGIIGVASLLRAPPDGESGPAWQLRGMAVDERMRGRGVGAAMLRYIEVELGEPLWCNARTSAEGFYEKLGWRGVGEVFDKPGVGPHRRMIRSAGRLR